MNEKVLLAPVPVVHLEDALSICEIQGEVAFGSNSCEFFSKVEQGAQAYIYASFTGITSVKTSLSPGRVVLRGIFERYTNGDCADQAKRPKSTLASDTKWAGFWYVSNLELVPLYLTNFSWAGPNPPLGPTFATLK